MHSTSSKYKYLYVSTEHGKSPVTGGIGSYIEEIQKLDPEGVLVLVCIKDIPASKNERNWLVLNDFFDNEIIDSIDLLILVSKAIQLIIEQHSSIQKIEIQEYLGIAALLLHLQRNKLFPAHIPIFVHCHGSSRYIENNNKEPLSPRKIDKVYSEKVAIDLTHNLRFPTNFLYQSYIKFDYNIDPNKVFLNRYPFYYPSLQSITYSPIDTLIFFGKRNAMKGYKEFTGAIQILLGQSFFLKKIKKIVLLGPDFGYKEENAFFKTLAGIITIEEKSLSRENSLAFIRDNASHALCILPYRGDNHPVSILEVISCQCPILAGKAGGIPELIPSAFHDKVLCDVSAISIAQKLEDYIKLGPNQLEQITTAIFLEMVKCQDVINEFQFQFPDNAILSSHEEIKNISLVKYQIQNIEEQIGIDDFLGHIEAVDEDYVVLSKIELKDRYVEEVATYIRHNKSLKAGILDVNPLKHDMDYPMLGDGLPALFLNQNYILSKVLYVKKSILIEVASTLNKETKIDAYFLIKLIVSLKKRNYILGIVYLNEEVNVFKEELLDNNSYMLMSILSEIGLNGFDLDRILKIVAFNSSNQNSLLGLKNKKPKRRVLFRIKQKLINVLSKLSKGNE